MEDPGSERIDGRSSDCRYAYFTYYHFENDFVYPIFALEKRVSGIEDRDRDRGSRIQKSRSRYAYLTIKIESLRNWEIGRISNWAFCELRKRGMEHLMISETLNYC